MRLKIKKIVLLWCFWFGVVTAIGAQAPVIHLSSVRMDKVGVDDFGLLYRDSKGYFWTSVQGNLCLLEGKTFKKYPFPTLGGAGEYVTSKLCELANGDLVFSSNHLMLKYDRKRDTIVKSTIVGLSGDLVLVHQDTHNGVFIFNRSQNTIELIPNNDPNPIKVGSIAGHTFKPVKSSNGQLRAICGWYFPTLNKPGLWVTWLGENGLARSDSAFTRRSAAKQPVLRIYDVFVENENLIWIAAKEGLYMFNPVNGYSLVAKFPQIKDVRGIVKDKNGTYWIFSSFGGLYCFSGKNATILHTVETNNLAGFSASRFSKMYLDHQDVLWLAFSGEGIAYTALSLAKFKTLNIKNQLLKTRKKDSPITAVCSMPEGDILIGTEGAGLLSWNPQTQQLKNVSLGPSFNLTQRIFYLFQDSRQRVWVQTKKHLYLREPSETQFSVIQLVHAASSKSPELFHLFEDSQKRLWATGMEHIYEVRQIEGKKFHLREHYIPQYPLQVITNGFAHKNGYFLLNNNYEEVLSVGQLADGVHVIPAPHAQAICAASDSSVWIGSSKGLLHYNLKQSKVDTPHPLVLKLPKVISNLAVSKTGLLWASSPQAIHAVDFNKKTLKTFHNYFGLNGDAFVKNSMALNAKNELVVANSSAIFLLPITTDIADSSHLQIYLKHLRVNDQPYKAQENINQIECLSFPYDSNTLTFEFLGIDYFMPDSVQLEYRLDGLDKPDVWVPVTEGIASISRYPNLAAGDYTFKVRSKDHKVQKALYVSISPPYYDTWWFRLLGLLLIGAALYGLYRIRLAQLMREKTLEQQKQNAELNALRAFINPHFLFNALNSINAFILTKKTEMANDYLADFSQLMRQMFDHSQNANVTIQEELDLLESYVKVEQRRFQQPFEYRVDVQADLDTYGYFVPSMILQPFVENAIWHGLQHQVQTVGVLKIGVFLENRHLVCIIEDNGVGRAKAAEIKQKQAAKHRSQGLHLTRLRIERADSINSLETTDLYDIAGNAAGTKVTVRINQA